jgi:hypothetical protein
MLISVVVRITHLMLDELDTDTFNSNNLEAVHLLQHNHSVALTDMTPLVSVNKELSPVSNGRDA